MTALSPEELALLRLMAEVGVPLRVGRQYSIHFLAHQTRKIPTYAGEVLSDLHRGKFIKKLALPGAPPHCMDYVLTDKGRQAADSE